MLENYGFAEDFEALVSLLACVDKEFYARFARHLDPGKFGSPAAQLAIAALRKVTKKTHEAPGIDTPVIQAVLSDHKDGKLTFEAFHGVRALFDTGWAQYDTAASSGTLNSVRESTSQIVKDAIKAQVQKSGVDEVLKAFQSGANMKHALEQLSGLDAIGEVKEHSVSLLDGATVGRLAADANAERFPCGISEVDQYARGGWVRGSVTLWLAETGGGKSMMLNHQAAVATVHGMFVAYASFENPEFIQNSRYLAALTGIPTNRVEMGTPDVETAWGQIQPHLGPFACKEFDADETPFSEVTKWIAALEESVGREIDMLCLDYISLVGPEPGEAGKRSSKKGKQVDTYTHGGNVITAFRKYIKDRGIWGHTAAQLGRQKVVGRRTFATKNDVEGSMHYPRTADNVVVVNKGESEFGDLSLWFKIEKHRRGAVGEEFGPFLPAFEVGRMVNDGLLTKFAAQYARTRRV